LDFSYPAGFTEFLSSDFLESWDDSGASSHGDKLNINTTNPSDSWKLVLKK
jgi:hypothetical protein